MLLEREPELASLNALVDSLDEDGGRVVLIRGEAGIGKSTLVGEFVDRHRDAHVLFGACDDLLTPEALGPFWDMSRDEPDIDRALHADDRHALFRTVLDLLMRSLRPTLIVIEDSQWADDATLDAITYLGRRIGRTNGLLVLTYRDTELDADHPLRQVLGDLPPGNVERIQLHPLSRHAIETMVGSRDLDVSAILAQTDGNPLFVTELLAADDAGGVPSSIRETALGRLARASNEARELLEVLAVIPGDAERDLVERLAAARIAHLDEAVHTGLVRRVGDSVAFAHELLRRAVEASIPAERRRQLNQSVLAALPPSADPARLAHHAREAGDVDAILIHGPAAARAAVAADSLRAAIDHFRAVEPHLDHLPPAESARILHELAQLEYDRDDPEALGHVTRAVEIRRGLHDPLALSESLVLLSMVEYGGLNTEIALHHISQAVEAASVDRGSREYARALRQQGVVLWLHYEDIPRALPVVDEALAIAEGIGDELAVMEAMTTKGNIEYSIGMPGGMEMVETVRAMAERGGYRWREVAALQNMSSMAADFRNMSVAVDLARRALETSIRYEQRALEKGTLAMYAEMLMWLGDWDRAIDAATGAFEGQRYTEAIAWRVIGTIQARRRGREGRAPLDRMWEVSRSTMALTTADPCAGALAEYMWLTGDEEPEWLQRCDELLAAGLEVGNPWPSGAFAFWMWKLGRLDGIPDGSADFYMGIPKGRITETATFWEDRGIGYEQALALMHGDQAQRFEALRLADDLGADALSARIREGLVADGLRVPRGRSRSTRSHGAGLTARQAEVLALLAEGMTNTEIADRLFLSPKTVENHVAAVLVKLEAPNRVAAVDEARRLGIA
jgi:DNA-binding CsgD family transcriptional regulator/tetratricopeptide (TPR) repeat protein